MKYILCLVLFCSSLIGYSLPSPVLQLVEEQNSDQSLQEYLSSFPANLYTICNVPRLGHIYVDDIEDGIKWHLRQGIYWESGIADLIREYTKPGTIAIDVGAHIGIHVLTMSRKVGKDGHVIAFEPQKKMYREMYHNVSINLCHHNTTLLNNALGNEIKMIEMNERDPINEGGTMIGSGGDQALMLTLDSLELNNVSLIKIDVEHHEKKVLEGAYETIIRNKPVIIFEVLAGYDYNQCPYNIREEFDAIFDLVKSMGYKVEKIHGADYIALPI